MEDISRDRQCIVEVLQKHKRKNVDIISFIETMRRLCLISKEKYIELNRTFEDVGYIKIVEFLHHLPFLKYEQIVFLFEEEGYHDISFDLRFKKFAIRYKRPPQIEMPHSRRTQDYYQHLKICIDNNKFPGDKRQQLRLFIQKQDKDIMAKGELSQFDRQYAMERKAAATVLLIQQYKDIEERQTILKQIIATETNGIDNTSLEIVFHSKMAITEADAGNEEKAIEHIVKTKEFCCMYKPCFAITSAFHDIEYAYKAMYFRKPSEDLLEKILTEGDIAVQSLNDENEDVQNLWKSIMLLFMVLSLLFVTPDFVVCDISNIKEIHKKRAEKILKEIKRLSEDMTLRRQMILHLCMAVLTEERDIKIAEKYALKALKAAEGGGCFREIEKKNINAYLSKIRRKMYEQTLFLWLIKAIILMVLIGFAIRLYVYVEQQKIDSVLLINIGPFVITVIASIIGSYLYNDNPFAPRNDV